jgi:hypothetical protein
VNLSAGNGIGTNEPDNALERSENILYHKEEFSRRGINGVSRTWLTSRGVPKFERGRCLATEPQSLALSASVPIFSDVLTNDRNLKERFFRNNDRLRS